MGHNLERVQFSFKIYKIGTLLWQNLGGNKKLFCHFNDSANPGSVITNNTSSSSYPQATRKPHSVIRTFTQQQPSHHFNLHSAATFISQQSVLHNLYSTSVPSATFTN